MEFSKKTLLPAIKAFWKLTCRPKSALTITENVLYNPETKCFYGTDLETGVVIQEPHEIDNEEDFFFCVNCKKFQDILSGIKEDRIFINMLPEDKKQPDPDDEQGNIFQQKARRLTINGNHYIIGINVDDFPGMPELEEINWSPNMLKADWIKRVNNVGGAKDDRRPHIKNLFFRDKELVSTDGRRLHWLKTDAELPKPVFIDKALAAKIACMGDAGFGYAESTNDYRFVVFAYVGMKVYHRMAEGDFPKYADIIARTQGDIAKIDRGEFLEKMRKFVSLSDASYKGVVMEYCNGNETANITYTNPDWGSVEKDELPLRENFSQPFRVVYNPEYMRDALNSIWSDEVMINVLSEDRPFLLWTENQESEFKAVVMPMRI